MCLKSDFSSNPYCIFNNFVLFILFRAAFYKLSFGLSLSASFRTSKNFFSSFHYKSTCPSLLSDYIDHIAFQIMLA